jgi:glycosyltransferase involved in cell wall biosynthesis
LRRKMDRSGIFEMACFLISGLVSAGSIIRQHRIEGCIAFFSLPSGPIGLLARWKWGLPYIVSLRGGDVPGNEPSLNFLHTVLTPIRRAVFKNAVAIAANSEGSRQMAEAADPFPVHVIPNGVDNVFFHPPPDRSEHFASPFRILFVGRFRPQKNLCFFLEQVARLDRNTFELHFVGDGPLKKELRKLAETLDLTEVTTWHGWVARTEMPAIYQSADCLVNPSLYEGMPNVVLEAMACGVPVIASRVPGNQELVVDGKTGFLFELNDPAQLSSALLRMRDADLRQRMSESARARVVELYSWKNAALQYVNLLSGCFAFAQTP